MSKRKGICTVPSITVFEIFGAEVVWPRSKTVQGNPRSKVIVPTGDDVPVRFLLTLSSYIFSDIWYHHQFWNNWCVIVMNLKVETSQFRVVFKFKGHGENRKSIDGFLYDLHWVQHCYHSIRDIWCKVLWPRSRTVQDHPRSKLMVPIDSTIMGKTVTAYWTSVCHHFWNIWRAISMILN